MLKIYEMRLLFANSLL